MATADTDVAAALVTSSLQSLVGGLTGQASDLRTLASLLGHCTSVLLGALLRGAPGAMCVRDGATWLRHEWARCRPCGRCVRVRHARQHAHSHWNTVCDCAAPVSFVDIERSVAGMESDVERVAQFLERERVAVAELEVRGDAR